MGSANITVYRGVRVTRQPLTISINGQSNTTFSFKAHPRQILVSADSLEEIHK